MFLGSVEPMIRPFLTRKSLERMMAGIRAQHALRIRAAVQGLAGDEDAVQYLAEAGLLAEMKLGPGEARERLKAIACSLHQWEARADHAEFHPQAPPAPPLRLPAEHEPIGAVIVSFPLFYPRAWKTHADFIKAITPEARALVLVRDQFWQKAVELYLAQAGADLARVRFFLLPTDDVWTRDYGPTIVFAGEEQRPAAVWNPYYIADQPYYKHDADAAAGLALALGLPLHRLPLVVEGGNIISDGRGTILMSASVLERNPEVDRDRLETIMRDYFGCTRLLTLPALPGEITGHVDMAVKFLDEDTLMVASAHRRHRWHEDLERIARTLAASSSVNGKAYTIVRLPLPRRPASPHCFWSHVNSLILNRRVLAPVFGVAEDAEALALYRSVLPGREVVGVDFSSYPMGSVHCQSKEVPVRVLAWAERSPEREEIKR